MQCPDRALVRSVETGSAAVIADPFNERCPSIVARLQDQGCQVFLASTLADAMALIIDVRPSFILTELKFPDGPGLQLVRWAAATLPAARTIVHSWFADIPIAVAAAKAGAADFVPKPTDDEFLANILLHGSTNIPEDCPIEEPCRVRQEYIEQVMRFSRSNVSLAARRLHLDRRSLQRMLKRYEASRMLEAMDNLGTVGKVASH